MRLKVTLNIGVHNAGKEDIIEIDDTELDGLSEDEQNKLFEEYWNNFAGNYIDGGWEILDQEATK